jgi:hypothetical protein
MEKEFKSIEELRDSNPKQRTFAEQQIYNKQLLKDNHTENEVFLVEELENITKFCDLCIINELSGDCTPEMEYLSGALLMNINSKLKEYIEYIIGAMYPIHNFVALKEFTFEMPSVNVMLESTTSWCGLTKANPKMKAVIKKESKKLLKDFPAVLTQTLDASKNPWAILVGLSDYYRIKKETGSFVKFKT